MNNKIIIKGAKEHNLKNINLEIPRDKLVVITGLSGSGKSSLAFDTLYAEGQRRYVESLSSYARQFLGIMEKPNVESIDRIISSNLNRSKNNLEKSTFHSRNSNRNIRLHSSFICKNRNSILPKLWQKNRKTNT
jgi:excinuclease UvrABC ATPase subunit